jgi:NAD(P)H-dependent flavin oxidoreductase YrpB (nitropropane dioxygenase family)
MSDSRAVGDFSLFLANIPGVLDTGIPIAASRCGCTGILNCEGLTDLAAIQKATARLARLARGPAGIKLEVRSPLTPKILRGLNPLDCVVLVAGDASAAELSKVLKLARKCGNRVLVEVTSEQQAAIAESAQSNGIIAGFIAKGQEAGGAVGEETTFILLQRLLKNTK